MFCQRPLLTESDRLHAENRPFRSVICTGTVMLEGDDTKYTQQYIEKLLGRPFSYIEFLNENFTAELKERAKPDFIKICRNATDD